jgi:hypothetical protein
MTRVRSAWSATAWLAVAALAVAAAACDEARSGGASVVPQGDGVGTAITPEGSFEGESINELKIRLDRLVGQQDRLTAASSTDAGKCEELCELSRAICEVKTKMCELADARVSDEEYQYLCREAKQRCQRASDSCIRCVKTHERAYGSGFMGDSGSCAGDPAVPEPKPE